MNEEETEFDDETPDAQELSQHEWAAFLQEFTRRHAGGQVILEMQSSDAAGQPEVIASGLPLSGVAFDSADGEEGTIQIMLGDTLTHVVEEPTSLWHYESSEDGELLEIEDTDGQTTRLRFGE